MTEPQVPHISDAPDRELSLNAVSRALLKVRARDGMTCAKLGKILECSADTIQTASNGESMLCFVAIARLVRFFPYEATPILDLLMGQPTLADRVRYIRAELVEIERGLR